MQHDFFTVGKGRMPAPKDHRTVGDHRHRTITTLDHSHWKRSVQNQTSTPIDPVENGSPHSATTLSTNTTRGWGCTSPTYPSSRTQTRRVTSKPRPTCPCTTNPGSTGLAARDPGFG